MFIVAIAPQLVLPINVWLMIPISAATLTLGAFVAAGGWSLAKHSRHVSGVLIFIVGVMISLVGVVGLLFVFLPWD
jgi:hypothetical protein